MKQLLLFCSMLSFAIGGLDFHFLTRLMPQAVKDGLSKTGMGFDTIASDVVSSFQPVIDGVQKHVLPPISPVVKGIERVIPPIHNVICYRYKTNLTKFLHFSPHHPNDSYPLVLNNMAALGKSQYDPNIPTKVIIHGFLDYIATSDYWMLRMKDALLKAGSYNVIIVDWSCGNFPPVLRTAENVKTVAEDVVNLLNFLENFRGVRMKDIHIIGHSLGAHIAGLVGRDVQNLSRISALDPAGPQFLRSVIETPLSASDAKFVDVIHTNGAEVVIDGWGYPVAAGHVDFYPDGGRKQRGCHSVTMGDIAELGIPKALWYVPLCDHMRSIDYYIESIYEALNPNGCQFVSVKCSSWETFTAGGCGGCKEPGSCAIMGFNADRYDLKSGSKIANEFYLTVNHDRPFCVPGRNIASDKNAPFTRD